MDKKEYIDRSELIKVIGTDTAPFTTSMVFRHIRNAPAADVMEVRHGRWLTTDAYPHHLYCSVCYKTYAKNVKWVNELDLPTNYCPNCGAKMDGGDNQ